jgi:hypothetical protein
VRQRQIDGFAWHPQYDDGVGRVSRGESNRTGLLVRSHSKGRDKHDGVVIELMKKR